MRSKQRTHPDISEEQLIHAFMAALALPPASLRVKEGMKLIQVFILVLVLLLALIFLAVQVRRVLKPGGSVHLLDFSAAGADAQGWLRHLFHSSRLSSNSGTRILTLLNEVEFVSPKKVVDGAARLGLLRIVCYKLRQVAPKVNLSTSLA